MTAPDEEELAEEVLDGEPSDDPPPDELTPGNSLLLAGTPLSGDSASLVTTSTDTRIVVLAGPIEAGKTTLIASIYHLFLEGPIEEVSFAGSLTLPAFEERCALARLSSGRSAPDTVRTERKDGVHFLHLTLGGLGSPRGTRTLLLADLTGEMYEEAADSAEACRKLSILRPAHFITLLVDGSRLAAPTTRHTCLDDTHRLVRRFLEEGMIGLSTHLQVAYSKWDEVLEREDENLSRVIDDFESEISQEAQHQLLAISFVRTAASPARQPDLGVGWGAEALVRDWVRARSPGAEFHLAGSLERKPRDAFGFGSERGLRVPLWKIRDE